MKKLIVAALLAFGVFGVVAVAPHQTAVSHTSLQVADGPPNPMITTPTSTLA